VEAVLGKRVRGVVVVTVVIGIMAKVILIPVASFSLMRLQLLLRQPLGLCLPLCLPLSAAQVRPPRRLLL
jgi:hypothetical protein